jgi:hypothetical protein
MTRAFFRRLNAEPDPQKRAAMLEERFGDDVPETGLTDPLERTLFRYWWWNLDDPMWQEDLLAGIGGRYGPERVQLLRGIFSRFTEKIPSAQDSAASDSVSNSHAS